MKVYILRIHYIATGVNEMENDISKKILAYDIETKGKIKLRDIGAKFNVDAKQVCAILRYNNRGRRYSKSVNNERNDLTLRAEAYWKEHSDLVPNKDSLMWLLVPKFGMDKAQKMCAVKLYLEHEPQVKKILFGDE